MQKLIFATNNKNKLREIQEILGVSFSVQSLQDAGIQTEIPEDFDTLQENALQKARFIHERTQQNVFADDTGLEVDALNGAPGVFSARYAGETANSDENIQKLLSELENTENRKARFRTVIALIFGKQEYLFEGVCEGTITQTIQGEGGFGYDPVFIPDGKAYSFAEMVPTEKNKISHRGRAVQKLVAFLKSN